MGSNPITVETLETLKPLGQLIRQHLDDEQARPVRPFLSEAEIKEQLHVEIPAQGQPFAEVIKSLGRLLALTPSTASASFFSQLYAGRDGAAFVGDVLASLLNNSMYTYKVGGPHILIENELVRHMGQLMGLDDPEGTFTPGGSLSNYAAMLVARNEAMPQITSHGFSGQTMRVYTSKESHYSVMKAAVMLGIGADNVVKIDVDERGRMLPSELDAAIETDKDAGFLPVMINATAGTTVLGAFDPIDAIADIAEKQGVWLHVDGAYGASMVFHPEYEPHLSGTSRADSITWDAHKIMGVPLTCSVVLVREKGLLTKHFNQEASYLFQYDGDTLNPGTRSMQCGRRNDALKLWTAWQTYGDAGYRDRVQRLRHLALIAREHVVERDDLVLVCEPESLNVCFQVQGVDPEALCDALYCQGLMMVGHAIVDEQKVMRLVLLNPDITDEDVEAFFNAVAQVSDELRA